MALRQTNSLAEVPATPGSITGTPSDSAIGSQGAEDLLDNVGYESFWDSERDSDGLFFLRGAPCGAFQPDFRIQRDTTALFKGIIGEEALRCGGPKRRSGWRGG